MVKGEVIHTGICFRDGGIILAVLQKVILLNKKRAMDKGVINEESNYHYLIVSDGAGKLLFAVHIQFFVSTVDSMLQKEQRGF